MMVYHNLLPVKLLVYPLVHLKLSSFTEERIILFQSNCLLPKKVGLQFRNYCVFLVCHKLPYGFDCLLFFKSLELGSAQEEPEIYIYIIIFVF